MRFSMKWILAAMAYIAVAAASFSQETWVYADLLWAATLIAFAFALHRAVFARGARQSAAAGFVVFCGGLALCLQFAPDSVPTNRVLLATGIGSRTTGAPFPITYWQAPAIAPVTTSPYPTPAPTAQPYYYPNGTPPTPVTTSPAAAPPTIATVAPAVASQFVGFGQSTVDFAIYERAASAVSTMAFGLLGLVLASFTSRRIRKAKADDTLVGP